MIEARQGFYVKLLGPVDKTPEEFVNGDFTLKTHQMFSVPATLEVIKNATITSHYAFEHKENPARETS